MSWRRKLVAQGKNHELEVGLRDTVLMGKDLVPVMELHRGARAGYSDPQRAWSVDHNLCRFSNASHFYSPRLCQTDWNSL